MTPGTITLESKKVLRRRTQGVWPHPAVIQPNHFVNKSLSNWAYNIAVGCGHACRFCYVPSASTVKQAGPLAKFGVQDPDAEWGDYVFVRTWDEKKFLSSVAAAERTPTSKLAPDGNRAVMFCSTTDPYQTFSGENSETRNYLNESARFLVRRALELIRDNSTLRVRILTRSPLAIRDFDIFKSFGNRLVFGMSIPSLRDDLAQVYEPRAPSPLRRLETLKAAKLAGLHVYAALAPTYPECDGVDFAATLSALASLQPITVFHEPINIRAENIDRIRVHAERLRIKIRSSVFEDRTSWMNYALDALRLVQHVAKDLGLEEKLHSWPDKSLGSKWVLNSMEAPLEHADWLQKSWKRISEWPN